MTLTVTEAISNRRATRKYKNQAIPVEVLNRVVDNALEAPSAFNAQMRDLVVIQDEAVKQAIFDASGQQQFLDAPVVFVVVGRSEVVPEDAEEVLGAELTEKVRGFNGSASAAKLREIGIRDAMLVAGFLLLAAQEQGLATSPTTGWNEEGVKKAIGLEGRGDRSIALVVAAGYADEAPVHPGRAENRRVDNHY
ncbi:nitroreductase family protein [Corynebacterium jeikeium]|jgi:FMN reductase [NAD(P)H]|uniref:nitroreductase family protein n=1 Tax=Corynebacterium jeikeium TaxID=38289 RepID=UPI0001B71579|nr:nitroreductase family protein [Corynebacterium jeikeium]EEW15630.1 nitroreductase family protein [Corynebacterium jeikeium ATCC 43734]OOD29515.1 dehydrogenase [Corynebacterium jeikeium]WCZ54750.1 Putative NAD(P)H nitroreductase MhqN [Corynebacterium jeikeium]SQI18832.1 NADH dehydrogenase [Corynebacterium jeikeium]SUY82148.1 NADH dehydrogenase [Corynebacterium jeikeium]